MALGRLQRDEPRLVEFAALRPELARLLEEFGPPRGSHHPELPFWYLRTDGLWVVEERSPLGRRRGKNQPTARQLEEAGAAGGFPEPLQVLLRSQPELVVDAARVVLEDHFPESLWEDVADACGVDVTLGDVLTPAVELEAVRRRRRDPAFRRSVLVAYENRCAVCGFRARLDGVLLGIDAAHVMWHNVGGPDDVANGMALCTLHHKALDVGAISIDEGHRVLVSRHVEGDARAEEFLLAYSGAPLVGPQTGEPPPARKYLDWHQREVFRDPARPPAA